MKREMIIQYLVLVLILIAGIVSFYLVRGNPAMQFRIGIVTSISYVVWGILHHTLEHNLHKKIVVEYLLIGAIAIVLLATIVRS